MVALEQIKYRDAALLLCIGIAPKDAVRVETDVDDPRVSHVRALA
jgi:hypothetical protein